MNKKAPASVTGSLPISKLEKINLVFGLVGLLADFAALLTFATGLINFNQVIPTSVPIASAFTTFVIVSGLLIAYGWFTVCWYLTRRLFVLTKYTRLAAFHFPLSTLSARAVAGIGLFLIPLIISWLVVSTSKVSASAQTNMPATPMPTPTSTPTPTATPTLLPNETPASINARTLPSSDYGSTSVIFGTMFGTPALGFVIWASINLLMPLIHVEMLDD